jgi:hypothetical protein
MKKTGQIAIPDNATLAEFADAWFEFCRRARARGVNIKEAAQTTDGSLEALMLCVIATAHQTRGMPLPPEIRKEIEQHPNIPDTIRKDLLKLHLS